LGLGARHPGRKAKPWSRSSAFPKTVRTDPIQSFAAQETPMVRIHSSDGIIGTGYSYIVFAVGAFPDFTGRPKRLGVVGLGDLVDARPFQLDLAEAGLATAAARMNAADRARQRIQFGMIPSRMAACDIDGS
jgi:hypothetical protein